MLVGTQLSTWAPRCTACGAGLLRQGVKHSKAESQLSLQSVYRAVSKGPATTLCYLLPPEGTAAPAIWRMGVPCSQGVSGFYFLGTPEIFSLHTVMQTASALGGLAQLYQSQLYLQRAFWRWREPEGSHIQLILTQVKILILYYFRLEAWVDLEEEGREGLSRAFVYRSIMDMKEPTFVLYLSCDTSLYQLIQ